MRRGIWEPAKNFSLRNYVIVIDLCIFGMSSVSDVSPRGAFSENQKRKRCRMSSIHNYRAHMKINFYYINFVLCAIIVNICDMQIRYERKISPLRDCLSILGNLEVDSFNFLCNFNFLYATVFMSVSSRDLFHYVLTCDRFCCSFVC